METAFSRFFGTLVAFLFVLFNGHLILIQALVRSFEVFRVGDAPLAFLQQLQPQRWGAEVFMLGLWIALPLVSMLLFVNLVLGLISRVAPQIRVFSVGFARTVSVGLIGMRLTLPLLEQPFAQALKRLVGQFQQARRLRARSGRGYMRSMSVAVEADWSACSARAKRSPHRM